VKMKTLSPIVSGNAGSQAIPTSTLYPGA